MSIQVDKVTKYYGAQKALNEVSFSINSGQIVGFLGPNGAGKSTMMKIITGYLAQSGGMVEVNGLDLAKNSLKIRRQIGYLPEHNPLYPEMYIKEYLQYVAGLYHMKDIKAAIAKSITMTGLQREQHKKIGQLSKGYRQRVGLAQAIIHQPDVLILDEPTTGLDPNQIIEIRSLIRQLGRQKTVLLSTHLMQEVEALCDRVIILKNGSLVADEAVQQIQQQAGGKVTIFIELNKEVDAPLLATIPGIGKTKKLDGNKWLLESTSQTDVRETIYNWSVQNKLALLAIQRKEKSMEEVFHELTR